MAVPFTLVAGESVVPVGAACGFVLARRIRVEGMFPVGTVWMMAILSDIAGAILVGVRIAPANDLAAGWALGSVGFVLLGLPALFVLVPAAAVWAWAVRSTAELL